MSDLFSKMIEAYKLGSSSAANPATQRRTANKIAVAERQNWHCAYCRVKMFAGTPAEDIHAYSAEMGIKLKRADVWWPDSFRALYWLRATIEHTIEKKYARVLGEYVLSDHNLVGACRYCNAKRNEWRRCSDIEWLEEVDRRINAKEHPLYAIILNQRIRAEWFDVTIERGRARRIK